MTCQDCIHHDVCPKQNIMAIQGFAEAECEHFINKERFVEIPEGAIVLSKKEIAALNEYQETRGDQIEK
jgi:hypothetical protein